MAVTGEIRVSDLLLKFLAHALILFCPLQAAGAIATGALQTVLNYLDDLFIFIQPNCHMNTSFFFLLYDGCQEAAVFVFLFSFNQNDVTIEKTTSWRKRICLFCLFANKI